MATNFHTLKNVFDCHSKIRLDIYRQDHPEDLLESPNKHTCFICGYYDYFVKESICESCKNRFPIKEKE